MALHSITSCLVEESSQLSRVIKREQVREKEVPSKYMAACGAVVVIGLFCWAGYAFFQYLLH